MLNVTAAIQVHFLWACLRLIPYHVRGSIIIPVLRNINRMRWLRCNTRLSWKDRCVFKSSCRSDSCDLLSMSVELYIWALALRIIIYTWPVKFCRALLALESIGFLTCHFLVMHSGKYHFWLCKLWHILFNVTSTIHTSNGRVQEWCRVRFYLA